VPQPPKSDAPGHYPPAPLVGALFKVFSEHLEMQKKIKRVLCACCIWQAYICM